MYSTGVYILNHCISTASIPLNKCLPSQSSKSSSPPIPSDGKLFTSQSQGLKDSLGGFHGKSRNEMETSWL